MIDWKKSIELLNEKALKALNLLGLLAGAGTLNCLI